MTQIWERLWVGGLQDAVRLAKGNPNGINTVISLCEQYITAKRQGVNYVHLAIQDEQPVPLGKFDAIIDAIAENIRWGTVLLHCGVGLSRAPSLAAAYMASVGYKNINAAITEIEQLRPFINPSRILLCSLKEYLK